MIPLKQKTGAAVAAAFQSIFNGGRTPKKLWVDKGKEFYNKDVKSLLESKSCSLYSTENEEKSCVVVRWNRTMKEKMFKYFSANSTRKYLDVQDEMVTNYNKTRHSSIKMTPSEASLKKNEATVYKNLYPNKEQRSSKPKFKSGDRVRINKEKTMFEKSYTPRWTEEVLTVSKIQYTDPPTYKIQDYNDKIRTRKFIGLKKIIRKRGNMSLVKWVGYDNSFNSWVENKDLIKLYHVKIPFSTSCLGPVSLCLLYTGPGLLTIYYSYGLTKSLLPYFLLYIQALFAPVAQTCRPLWSDGV